MLIVAGIGISRGKDWLSIFMYSISLAVAAIPEGLPTIVTLALALAVRRMSKRNAIVRKMSSVESLGSTDIICTDKTGTLTTGNMIVRDIFTLTDNDRSELDQAAVDCNNASIDDGRTGDPTEIALLLMAENRRRNPRLHEWSFDSRRKRMSVAVETAQGNKVYTKGAPEETISLCHLNQEQRQRISEVIANFAGQGRRILALASRNYPFDSFENAPEASEVEKDLTFLGLVALADPPKKETIPAISACRSSGIKVIMITGDHPLTAGALARELGIIKEESPEVVMTGAEVENLSAEEL
jgi:Ca2+-transporting ATPase